MAHQTRNNHTKNTITFSRFPAWCFNIHIERATFGVNYLPFSCAHFRYSHQRVMQAAVEQFYFVCFSNTIHRLSLWSLPHRPNFSFWTIFQAAAIKTTIRYAYGPTLPMVILRFLLHILIHHRVLCHCLSLSLALFLNTEGISNRRQEILWPSLVFV